MPNELTYTMPQIAWLTLWLGDVTYLCHVATRVVARSSTHEDSVGTLGLSSESKVET